MFLDHIDPIVINNTQFLLFMYDDDHGFIVYIFIAMFINSILFELCCL